MQVFEVTRESWSRGPGIHVGYFCAADAESAKKMARVVIGSCIVLDAFIPQVRLLDDDPVTVATSDGKHETKTMHRVCAMFGIRQ